MSNITIYSNSCINNCLPKERSEEEPEKQLCKYCGKHCMKVVKNEANEDTLVCESCCDVSLCTEEKPLFIIKTKIYSDLLTQKLYGPPPNVPFFTDNADLWPKLMNIKASKSIQTDDLEPEDVNVRNNLNGNKDDEQDDVRETSVEIFNYKKLDYNREFSGVNGDKNQPVVNTKTKRGKYVKCKPMLLKDHLVQVGHKECIVPHFSVPSNKGWSWDLAKTNHYGIEWSPGAIDKKVYKIMKVHQNQFCEANKEKLQNVEKPQQRKPTKVDKSSSPIDLSKIIAQN